VKRVLASAGPAVFAVVLLAFIPAAIADHNVREQVSVGPLGGNGAFDAEFRFASTDGGRVFFETAEQLAAADTDSVGDVYQRAGGATTLLSMGSTGGDGPYPARATGISTNGATVFFTTAEQLTADDTDSSIDVYRSDVGSTRLVSTGPVGGQGAFDASFLLATGDGLHVVFSTAESLVAADTDSDRDS
jgi:hypothetical protein